MPVVRLSPVFAFEVVRVMLVEVSLGIEDAPLPEDLGHAHISGA